MYTEFSIKFRNLLNDVVEINLKHNGSDVINMDDLTAAIAYAVKSSGFNYGAVLKQLQRRLGILDWEMSGEEAKNNFTNDNQH